MKKNKTQNRPIIITFITVVLLVILATVSSWDSTANWIENAVGTVFTPIQGFAANTSDAIADFFNGLFDTTDVDKENERLTKELAQFNQLQLQFDEMQKQNERLKELLNYAESLGNFELCTARIVAKSTGIWFNTLTLNVGRNKGVEVDMAVICADGLVGKVTEVGATWCKVTAIIDSGMTVPVMVERTRDNCMVRGILDAESNDAYLELYYLPSDRADIAPGDAIITSGIGDVYPKGIFVGTITEVITANAENNGSITNAIIAPAVDFTHLEEVSIIIGTADTSAGEGE